MIVIMTVIGSFDHAEDATLIVIMTVVLRSIIIRMIIMILAPAELVMQRMLQ